MPISQKGRMKPEGLHGQDWDFELVASNEHNQAALATNGIIEGGHKLCHLLLAAHNNIVCHVFNEGRLIRHPSDGGLQRPLNPAPMNSQFIRVGGGSRSGNLSPTSGAISAISAAAPPIWVKRVSASTR